MSRTASLPPGISRPEGDFVVDAEVIAPKLGLPVQEFWRELKRGIVYSTVERREGKDAGRMRLTFRYRSRSWSVALEDVAS